MDPATLGVSGGISLISMLLNDRNQRSAQATANQGIVDARNAREEMRRLATSTRTDAYGNQVRYNPATNEWETILTPTQRGITSAGESEQLKSLTVDAPAARRIRQRAQRRGDDASEDYNTALADYRYAPRKSEETLKSELMGLLSQAQNDAGNRTAAGLSRTALRAGRGQDVGNILAANTSNLGSEIAELMLKARTGAMGEHAAREDTRRGKLADLRHFSGMMDTGGDAPIRFSDIGDKLGATQGNAIAQALQALASGSSNLTNATGIAAKTASGKDAPFDLRGMASLYSALNGKGAGVTRKPKTVDEDYAMGTEAHHLF